MSNESSQTTTVEPSVAFQWAKVATTALLVPALGLTAHLFTVALEERNLAKDYVELAVSILRSPETNPSDAQAEINEWAVNLLDLHSPVEIPEKLKQRFVSGTTRLPELSAIGAADPYTPTQHPSHCTIHLRHGNPSAGDVVCRLGFAFGYDTNLRITRWVSYRLVNWFSASAERARFRTDHLFPQHHQVVAAYRASGFDRGHLVPLSDVSWHSDAAQEAQFHTNLAPQHPQLNRGAWLSLEQAVRGWSQEKLVLYVIAGPVFDTDNPRQLNDVLPVPDAFFKIIFDPSAQSALAFMLPNGPPQTAVSLSTLRVSVDDIETRTGLDLLSDLPQDQQSALESEIHDMW
ncbi:MAG: DNA/RNA non-specific endonuclease [Gammaproteobacteria bacterium]|nr:DNA/RNA non-specific endonuclease [Gammaproteobacteria bacterium]